jgi:hypothetical protein
MQKQETVKTTSLEGLRGGRILDYVRVERETDSKAD